MKSIKNKFVLGDFYTKNSLSEIIQEPNLKLVRKVYDDMKSYLKKHRTKFFEKN